MARPPKPLEVNDARSKLYEAFLQEGRNFLSTKIYSLGVPVLPPIATKISQYKWAEFQLNLKFSSISGHSSVASISDDPIYLGAGPATIVLRVRTDNLYLDGYKDNKGNWWEFRQEENGKEIKELLFKDVASSKLPFFGNYDNLEMEAGPKSRDAIKLGQTELMKAVQAIADTKAALDEKDKTKAKDNRKKMAQSFIVIIQMVCEAIRFRFIADFVSSNYSSGKEPTKRILQLEQKWDFLSKALLLHDRDPTKFKLEDNNLGPDDTKLQTVADAAPLLGMVKNDQKLPLRVASDESSSDSQGDAGEAQVNLPAATATTA